VSDSQLGNIESLVDSFGIRISSLLITEAEAEAEGALQRLSRRSGGASYRVVRPGRTLAMYSDLVEALRNLIAVDTKVTRRTRYMVQT
jgi:hypothetical protein